MKHWQVVETGRKEPAFTVLVVSYFMLLKQYIGFKLAIIFGIPLTKQIIAKNAMLDAKPLKLIPNCPCVQIFMMMISKVFL